jgi:hypothetical protein
VLGLGVAAGWLLARLISARRRPLARLGASGAHGGDGADGTALAADRLTWRMPPLALLRQPAWSARRRVGLICLRGYLVGAVLLVILKIVQLAAAH